MFPAEGPLSFEKYPKHIDTLNMSTIKPIRLVMSANGVGKTMLGCYETTCHATGIYPDWWEGKRYPAPTNIIIAGSTTETVRDIIQPKLLGKIGDEGTGVLPGDLIISTAKRPNSNGGVDYVLVKHISGGTSTIHLKSYEMGRKSFEGFEADFIWLDEECDVALYAECVQRFRTRDISMLLTFTPQKGITELVQLFCPQYNANYNEAEYEISGRAMINITQDEVPHLTKEEIERGYANAPPHLRDAKRYGLPSAGAGKVYPVDESNYVINPLPRIPRHYRRLYGLDVGLRCTAAVWGAQDAETGVVYVYSEHYMTDALPPVHAVGMKARGVWIPGVVDPAARGRNASDGKRLIDTYRALGLRLKLADNAVEMGIQAVLEMMQSGRLKIYSTCTNLLREIRMYSRDDKNRVIKANDHAVDALRYLIMMLRLAETPHAGEPDRAMHEETFGIYARG